MKRAAIFVNVLVLVLIILTGTSITQAQVIPQYAYDLIVADYNNGQNNVYILDVRTPAEWKWVGHPAVNKMGEGIELEGKVVNVSWMIEKRNQWIKNPSFLSDVDDFFEENPSVTLLCLCRSGNRAAAAAAFLQQNGYPNAAYIAEGFQGGADDYGYRTINGWMNIPLPYKIGKGKDFDGYNE